MGGMGPCTRRTRRSFVAAALSALLVPIAAVAADTRAERRTATEEARDPQPAARISRDLRTLPSRSRDLGRRALRRGRGRTVCPTAGKIRCDSGLGLRTLLVDTVMRRAESLRRRLGGREAGVLTVTVRLPGGSVRLALGEPHPS
ncbi:hypothetical protein SLNWT_5897 [Streptomyces albus]|uniref:Uncharacterized protein n=2 Tax=Streptomyces TaxID=1883 RepID=A0A0B5ETW0_STRA4|nr:hypothetical protein SLNWT_5897 [Streptomyces albus]AOU80575.1 hypothetical protein SLNHY_5884 [Streptomyces albus]